MLASPFLALSAPAWTPLMLGSGVFAGWSARRPDSMTLSGGAVSSWRDLVAGYDAAQAVGASRPVYDEASQSVAGDGVDDELTLAPVPAGIPINAVASRVYARIRQDALAADGLTRPIVGWGGAATVQRRLSRAVVGGVNRSSMRTGDGTGSLTVNGSAVDLSSTHRIVAGFGATGSSLAVDGNTPATGSVVPATSNSRLRLFCDSATTAGLFFKGRIHDLWITADDLSADLHAQMMAYLSQVP